MNNIKVNLDDVAGGNSPYIKLTNVKTIDKETYDSISEFFGELGIDAEFYTDFRNLKQYEETRVKIAEALVSQYHYDPTNVKQMRKLVSTICIYFSEHKVGRDLKLNIDRFISDVKDSLIESLGTRFSDLTSLEVLNMYSLIVKGEL